MVDADKIRDVPQRKDWGEVTRYVEKIWLQLDQVQGRAVESPGRRMTEGEADIKQGLCRTNQSSVMSQGRGIAGQ